jgi:signal transduction histidine kinase
MRLAASALTIDDMAISTTWAVAVRRAWRSADPVAPRVRIAVVAACGLVVCVLGAAAPYWADSGIAGPLVAIHVSVAASAIGAGLIVWWLRPENRTSLLLIAAGFLWLIGDLGFADNALAYTIAITYPKAYQAVLAHLALAYPTGRLQSRTERILVVVTYGWTALNNLVHSLYVDPSVDCTSCPQNLLLIRRSPQTLDVIDRAATGISLVLMLVVGGFIVRRWYNATVVARRVMAPVLWAVGPVLVYLVGEQIADLTDMGGTANTIVRDVLPLALTALPIAMLVGVLRARLAYVGVGALVGQLGVRGRDLRGLFAEALHDPSVELYYRAGDGYVNREGMAVDVDERPGRLVRVIEHEGSPLAVLIADQAVSDEPRLVDAVVAAGRLTIENERLEAEVRSQLVQLRSAAARLVDAGEHERRRIERDLHDGAQQRLLALSLSLASARQQDAGAQAEVLDRAGAELQQAITELRELARGIHPVLLAQGGLAAALQALAERSPLPVEVSCPRERWPEAVEATAYFVASEAVTNAMRYAHAGVVEIKVTTTGDMVCLSAADDGIGGAEQSRGSGLRGLADRVTALGGRLEVESGAGGTTIKATLPCA